MFWRFAVVAIALAACGRIGFGERSPSDGSSDAAGPPAFPLVLPAGGTILQLAIAPGGTWYARSAGSGVYRSANQGVSWTPCVSGPPPSAIGVGPDDTVYFAGATMRISVDECDSFTALNTTRFSNNVGRHGAFAYALTDQGIERRGTGAWTTVATVASTAFGAFDASAGVLLAGSTDGVYSSDLGGVWTPRTAGFATRAIRGVAAGTTKTYAITGALDGSPGGISCGNADASAWAPCPAGFGGTAIAVDPTNEDHVIAGVYDDLGETIDGFDTMMVGRRGAGGMPNAIVNDIDFTPTGDLVLSSYRGIDFSPAGTLAFESRNAGLYAWTPTRLLVDGDDLFVATEAGLARSLGGATLAIDTPGIPQDVEFRDMAIDANGDVLGIGRGIWRSTDRGATWMLVYSLTAADDFRANSLELDGDRIYAGTQRRLVYSTPPYTTWTPRAIGPAQSVFDLLLHDGELWAGTTMGLYMSAANDPDRMTFTRIDAIGGSVTSIATLSNGGLLVGTTTGVWVSDEMRASWTMPMSLSTRTVMRQGTIALAATTDGVFASRDDGASWTLVPESDGLGTRGLAIDPGSGEVIYGVSGRGVSRAAIP